jgi:hypothetical protein
MVEPPPGRFSMMMGLPSRSATFGWMMRASVSTAPPAAQGTISVTGRVG